MYGKAKMGILRLLLSWVVLLSAFVPASAQWLKYRTPGMPRTADGKPNLSAPAPKTPDGKPDLSGLWQAPEGKYLNNPAADGTPAPSHPSAEAFFQQLQASDGK